MDVKAGLNTNNNMGGLYIRFDIGTNKDDLRELYRVLEVTTDKSKLQIPCNCDVKLSDTL